MLTRLDGGDGGPSYYQCSNCGKTGTDKRSLRRHAEVHLDLKHNCQMCDKVSKTRVGLAQHYSKYHPEVTNPWSMI